MFLRFAFEERISELLRAYNLSIFCFIFSNKFSSYKLKYKCFYRPVEILPSLGSELGFFISLLKCSRFLKSLWPLCFYDRFFFGFDILIYFCGEDIFLELFLRIQFNQSLSFIWISRFGSTYRRLAIYSLISLLLFYQSLLSRLNSSCLSI